MQEEGRIRSLEFRRLGFWGIEATIIHRLRRPNMGKSQRKHSMEPYNVLALPVHRQITAFCQVKVGGVAR